MNYFYNFYFASYFLLELLFDAFADLIGQNSIQFANGAEGRKRRQLIDESFSHSAVTYYYDDFVKVCLRVC